MPGLVVRTIDAESDLIVETFGLLLDGSLGQYLARLAPSAGVVDVREFVGDHLRQEAIVYARRLSVSARDTFDSDAFLGQGSTAAAPTPEAMPMDEAEFWSILENTAVSDAALVALERRLRRLRAGVIRSFAASIATALAGLDARVLDAISATAGRAHFTRTGARIGPGPSTGRSFVGCRFIVAVASAHFEVVTLQVLTTGDSDSEPQLVASAGRAAAALGGRLESRVDSCDLDAVALTSGTTIFEVRTRSTTGLNAYLADHFLRPAGPRRTLVPVDAEYCDTPGLQQLPGYGKLF